MKIRNEGNNVEDKETYKLCSILLGDEYFLFRFKKKSTSPTWKYFDAKNNNGITLIALIITIIIMLILAGVVISLTLGEKGIFTTAKNAGKNYTNAAEYEQKELRNLLNNIYVKDIDKTIDIKTLKAGDYVKYDSGSNGIITCRVLYPLSSPYGLQIISDKNVGNPFTLGSQDNFEDSKSNYNNVIELLNNIAETYINFDYAYDARCVGSNPTVQNGVLINKDSEEVGPATVQFISYTGTNTTELKDEDTNYEEDERQMKSFNIWNTAQTYWLASRKLYTTQPTQWCNFCIRIVNNDATLGEEHILGLGGGGKVPYLSNPVGFRPCILLKSNTIKIASGDGKSEETAYILEK